MSADEFYRQVARFVVDTAQSGRVSRKDQVQALEQLVNDLYSDYEMTVQLFGGAR